MGLDNKLKKINTFSFSLQNVDECENAQELLELIGYLFVFRKLKQWRLLQNFFIWKMQAEI